MKSFAQQQNQLGKQKSSSLARWKPTIRRANDLANPISDLQHTIGNRAVLRLLQAHRQNFEFGLPSMCSPRAEAIQTKLMINQPGDIYEEEADRISEQVVNTSVPQTQRSCASAGDLGGPTEQPGKQGERLQTKHVGLIDVSQTAIPPIVQEVLLSSGQLLDPGCRFFMEPRLGRDFSEVRVHTDSKRRSRHRRSAQPPIRSAITWYLAQKPSIRRAWRVAGSSRMNSLMCDSKAKAAISSSDNRRKDGSFE
jgi:uncharacterized protein DUF4157